MNQRYNVVNGTDSAFDPSECVGDRFDETNVELVARDRRVVPVILEDDLLDPRDRVVDRFDRTNVKLVAGNGRMIPRMIEGDLLRRFDQIKVEPVAGTKIVARGIP